jgi:hypothetical protein
MTLDILPQRYLSDTNSSKWFCQFGLVEKLQILEPLPIPKRE